MQLNRKNIKGRRTSDTFLALPHNVINHPDFISLSPRALKLLIDMASQYRGCNNGDLCVAFSIMSKRDWKSKSLLQNAIKELLAKEFIILTRQGGRKIPGLYAITWRPIDDCNNKLDIKSTKLAPKSFRV